MESINDPFSPNFPPQFVLTWKFQHPYTFPSRKSILHSSNLFPKYSSYRLSNSPDRIESNRIFSFSPSLASYNTQQPIKRNVLKNDPSRYDYPSVRLHFESWKVYLHFPRVTRPGPIDLAGNSRAQKQEGGTGRGNTRRRRRGGVGKGCSACNSPDLMERGDLITREKGERGRVSQDLLTSRDPNNVSREQSELWPGLNHSPDGN